jgi:hypothetical protein
MRTRWIGLLGLALVAFASTAGAGTRLYTRPHKAPLLLEELAAAGIPARVESDGRQQLRLTVPDDLESAADAVVGAHDPTRPSQSEALEAQRVARETARRDTLRLALEELALTDAAQLPAMIDALFPTLTEAQRQFLARLARAVLVLLQESQGP